MGRARFTPEQINGKLREAEVLLGHGTNIGEATRKLGVSEQTYCRWRKEYGGMRVDQPHLDCGNPRCGFARIRCPDCREERLLMFSCRTRGFWTLQLQLTKSSSKRFTKPPG